MTSTFGVAFNTAPTLSNFRALASHAPAEAKVVLARLVNALAKGAADPKQLQRLNALLALDEAQLSKRVSRATVLRQLFPNAPSASSFADVVGQLSNLPSLNWTADAVPPQIALTGTVSRKAPYPYTLTTAAGRTYELLESGRPNGLTGSWLEGFINAGEGQMTLQGTVSADGKTFLVEAYAPGTSADFVMGRLQVKTPLNIVFDVPTDDQVAEALGPNGRVYITTSRGEIEVTNPDLKKVLVKMPQLGLILPGVVKRDADGRLSIDSGPDFLYALGGRFSGLIDKGDGVFQTDAVFAYDNFKSPVVANGEAAKWRMQNSQLERNWVGGRFRLDAPTPYFEATYISNDLNEYDLQSGVEKPEGSAALQLLAASEVVEPAAAGFERVMGPVPEQQ